jgi:hypothetical protein
MTSLQAFRCAVEKLHSNLSSSSRVTFDRPPSHPLSRRSSLSSSSRVTFDRPPSHPLGRRSSLSSSSRVTVDRPPHPLSRRQMVRRPSSDSVKETHKKDSGVGDAHRRGNAVERLQQSDSKWTSSSGVTADRPPLQPLRRRRSAVGWLQQSDSRWSSGSRATFDTTSSKAIDRHRSDSALEMNNHDIFEPTVKALCTLNLLGKPQSLAVSVPDAGLHCAARTA